MLTLMIPISVVLTYLMASWHLPALCAPTYRAAIVSVQTFMGRR